MDHAAGLKFAVLDGPTLSFAAACLGGLLGSFLISAWLQQRNIRALAWWGSAYLIGASAIAFWGAPSPFIKLPPECPEALMFVACGMIWNGVRLFHGRRLWPAPMFGGAIVWLIVCQAPAMPEGSTIRIAFGAIVVSFYTFFIAVELWRERRKSLFSRTAAVVVPCVHAAIFLMPLAMRALLPDVFTTEWQTVLALETIIYAIGTAFIMLLMVKDHHVHFYRLAATTDHLTGLFNRRAFLEAANVMAARQSTRGEAVTLLMFDLDRFKSINDRFGHGVGDSALKVFADVASSSVRSTDVFGRLGGEEFAAIIPEETEGALQVAERLRLAFQDAGVTIDGREIGATVSIGVATSYAAAPNLDALLLRADEALYAAKNGGRNRYHVAPDEPGCEQARQAAAARSAEAKLGIIKRRLAARRARKPDPVLAVS
ncbi:MAG TPA: GGDEF domain-containing protein [Pseudolabrys sp.]|jgi:diguanylate cyclase (GGDEF)-like protein